MRQTARRRLGLLLIVAGAAVPLALVSVAFACGRLVSLHLNPDEARPGATISAYGRNYNTTPRFGDVTVRFNSRRGPILWQGKPDRFGRIAPSFRVPRTRAGNYMIVATQTAPDGTPAAGTPGRDTLRVAGRRETSRRVTDAAVWGPPSGDGGGPRGEEGVLGDLRSFAGSDALAAGLLMLAFWVGGGLLLVTGRRAADASPARRA